MELKFKKLHPDAILPARATPCSAGMDISACFDRQSEIKNGKGNHVIIYDIDSDKPFFSLYAHETVYVPTGLAVESSENEIALLVYPRSSLATKHRITLANSVAVIDSDYRGEIMIPLHNSRDTEYRIYAGDRIAQMIATPIIFPVITETDTLSETERGAGGFGSTGK